MSDWSDSESDELPDLPYVSNRKETVMLTPPPSSKEPILTPPPASNEPNLIPTPPPGESVATSHPQSKEPVVTPPQLSTSVSSIKEIKVQLKDKGLPVSGNKETL